MQNAGLYSRLERVYTTPAPQGSNFESVNALIATEFSQVFDRVSLLLLVRLFTSSIFLFGLSIFVSHKIAGPARRIERAILAMQKGDLTGDTSKLRQGDELDEIANALHSGLGRIRGVIDECRVLAERIESAAQETQGHAAQLPSSLGGLKNSANKTQHVAKQLLTAIGRLKTHSGNTAKPINSQAG
jgi:methyl-accepting chemotaxis protein